MYKVKLPFAYNGQYDSIKIAQQSLFKVPTVSDSPWRKDGKVLNPCWNKTMHDEWQISRGFITFSLTNGPEYHVSQIADAVVVARYLKAILVLPDIKGTKPGDVRPFEEIYDVEKFIQNLDGVVMVAKKQPSEQNIGTPTVVRIPNMVSEEQIASQIEPSFREKGNIRISTYFPSVSMKKPKDTNYLDSFACLGMFGTLELQQSVQQVVDSMVRRLRALNLKSKGQFVAVDLRVEMLGNKHCQNSKKKTCYSAQEIGQFLKKVGFHRETTIYLTQSGWHRSLDKLKEIFPKTYIKHGIMPTDQKAKFLNLESSEFEKIIDFYICSQSDVFVPSTSDLFYANVAGKRIASGKTQILVPAQSETSSVSAASSFLSPYISNKTHLAYSCFC